MDKTGPTALTEDEVINQRENFSIRSVEFNHHKNELIVGDMLGCLSIFDCDDYKLSRKVSLATSGIEDLSISPKGSVLGVSLSSGESFLCDCSRNYQKILVLESSYDDYRLKASGLVKSIRLIQDELERSSIFENLADNSSSMNVNLSSAAYKTTNRSASPPLLGKSNFPKYYVKTENAIKSVTVHNSSTLRLQQIYRDDFTISATSKTVYCVDGKLTSFQVHPSNDYIIVLSNIGFLYIFKLINADLRVKIAIPSLSRSKHTSSSRPSH